MGPRTLLSRRSRIHLELARWARARQHRELGAFAGYCIARLEREVGTLTWVVTVAPDPQGGFLSKIVARQDGGEVGAPGAGRDATLAIWDAICNIEQTL